MPCEVALIVDDPQLASALSQDVEACDAHPTVIDTLEDLAPALSRLRPDVAVCASADAACADGTAQAVLELLGVSLAGSSASAIAQACDRSTLSQALGAFAFLNYGALGTAAVPPGIALSQQAFERMGVASCAEALAARIPSGYPLAVRTLHKGRGCPAAKVDDTEELTAALACAYAHDSSAFVQEWVDGVQISVSVLGQGADAYAFAAVEHADGELYAPARLTSLSADESDAQAIRNELERAAVEAHEAYGARDLSCVELVWDGGRACVLDIDLVPPLDEDSAFARSCGTAGVSIGALVGELVDQAYART